MKRCLIFVMVLINIHTVFAQISVMSYNIRYHNPNDKDNWWEYRKRDVTELIEKYHPDFLGIQEGLYKQVQYILTGTSDYNYIGVGRDDGETNGEYVALYYDTTKYELLHQETFWLSVTPEKVSIGWDASMERICTYGHFRNKKTTEEIYVFNAHYDHLGVIARNKSSELIIKKIKDLNIDKTPIVVLGDLNSEPQSRPIKTLNDYLKDSRTCAQLVEGPEGTFNGFKKDWDTSKRIDYVFVKNLEIDLNKHIDDKRENGLWVSDHLPVLVKVSNK